VTPPVLAAYLACALIWGTTWYAIRVCITGYPTLASVALRFVIVGDAIAGIDVIAAPDRLARLELGEL